MEVAKSLKLNSGYEMPTVGLGTFTMFKNPEGEMARVTTAAVKAGYKHIDTAMSYGTEPLIGPVLTEIIKSGEITREEIFITCKVWCTHHHPDSVKATVEQSLVDLQISYIDMLLIHWPMAYKHGDSLFPKDEEGEMIYADDDYLDTWKAMEECVEKGQVRSLGISNFNIQQMKRLCDVATIQPSNHQIELNAYFHNQEVADWCKEKGMVVSCYAPLSSPGRFWKEGDDPNLLEEETMKQLAEKYSKTAAQVALRFLLQKGYVVLPKSVTDARIAENINVYDFELSSEDMAEIAKLDRNLRAYAESMAKTSPYYPF